MFEYISGHQCEFWLVIGVALLALEILLSFAAGVFLFAGLGAIIAGCLMAVGVLPETWIAGIAAAGIGAGVFSLVLWKPLKSLQNSAIPEKDNSSDLLGYEFILSTDLTFNHPSKTQYSGLTWQVVIDDKHSPVDIPAGSKVKVTSVDVGVFKVSAL